MLIPYLFLALVTLASPTVADVPTLARAALGGDEAAVGKLRALGPPGLDALVKLRRELDSVPPLFVGLPTPRVLAWEALVDKVARQKYASASGLYWYTDLDQAKAAARAQGKPILSLRLLGDLGEDLSCANSRFFRTVLYPDPHVAQALHDGWILHWESVHDAPKITIDFGGGRVLRRTITGNSMHYALTADGDVADVMPGMVGPEAFAAWLDSAGAVARQVGALPPAVRAAAIATHMRADLDTRLTAWNAALKLVGVDVPRDADAMAKAMTDEVLGRLAASRRVSLSPEVMRLVGALMAQTPGQPARDAMPLAVSKAVVESPMLRMLGAVRGTLARDEVRNELEMKSRVLAVALDADLTSDAGRDDLTRRIYARAFLTPLDDPWMGLAPPDVFTGLPADVEKSDSASR